MANRRQTENRTATIISERGKASTVGLLRRCPPRATTVCKAPQRPVQPASQPWCPVPWDRPELQCTTASLGLDAAAWHHGAHGLLTPQPRLSCSPTTIVPIPLGRAKRRLAAVLGNNSGLSVRLPTCRNVVMSGHSDRCSPCAQPQPALEKARGTPPPSLTKDSALQTVGVSPRGVCIVPSPQASPTPTDPSRRSESVGEEDRHRPRGVDYGLAAAWCAA